MKRILALVLLAGCGAAVPHNWLTACPDGRGVMDYGQTCPIQWGHMPLRVAYGGPSPAPALAWWNGALGVETFVIDGVDPDILLVFEGPRPEGVTFRGGRMVHARISGRLIALIGTWDNGPDARDMILAHELGHVLGLAHDGDDAESIMHPTLSAGQPYYLRDDDRQALLDRYGRL